MTRRGAGATALVAVLTLGACGTTYVDSEGGTAPPSNDTELASATSLPPIGADTPLPDLLTEIESLMSDLDERIIADDGDTAAMARIEELWAAAEPRIRDRDPDDVFNFEQAVELARTGVERRRPADASKGLKILTDVIDAYLAR